MPSIEEKVKQIIVEQLGVEEAEVVPAARLQEDLGADSLDIVELTMALEAAFDIEIPDEDVADIRAVQDVCDSINSHVKVGASNLGRRGGSHRDRSSVRHRQQHRGSLAQPAGREERHRKNPAVRCLAVRLADRREVRNFDPLQFIEKKEIKKMGRFIHFAIAAADEAIKSSGLQVSQENAAGWACISAAASAGST